MSKDFRPESELFSKYMDAQYAKNYQHFANIVKKAEDKAKANAPMVEQEEPTAAAVVPMEIVPEVKPTEVKPLEPKPIEAMKKADS